MRNKPIKKIKKAKTPKKVKKSPKTVEPCGCGVYIPDRISGDCFNINHFDYTVNTMCYLI